MNAAGKLGWDEFAAAVAEIAQLPVGAITAKSRLLEDLRLDSLAFAEVIVLLIVELEMAELDKDLAGREWEGLTVGQIFDEYQHGDRPPGGKEYVIRERRRR